MPIRDESGAPITPKDKRETLVGLTLKYLKVKKDITKLTDESDSLKVDIKSTAFSTAEGEKPLYILNNKHKEVTLPVGDGLNEVFIQLQCRESISINTDAVEFLRKKLGSDAETYIRKVETLHENALELLHAAGKLSDDDILAMTTSKATESLIVKLNKKKTGK